MIRNRFEAEIGNVGKIVIEEIQANELEGKVCLGSAYGTDLGHCVGYIGLRHCNNFKERVKWYYLDEKDKHLSELRKQYPEMICVNFYS